MGRRQTGKAFKAWYERVERWLPSEFRDFNTFRAKQLEACRKAWEAGRKFEKENKE